jgi:hypothetical protein
MKLRGATSDSRTYLVRMLEISKQLCSFSHAIWVLVGVVQELILTEYSLFGVYTDGKFAVRPLGTVSENS